MNPLDRWLHDAQTPPNLRYVDTCDGLRALAMLMVGWFHIWQQSWLYPGLELFGRDINFDPYVRSGYIYVDVLILISGFCLYLPWARQKATGESLPDTLDFYAKRLIRIHPSYLLTLALMLCVALLGGVYSSAAQLRLDLIAHLTYTQTFFYESYYATNLGGTLWTLAIEMQFYLIFPLLARAFSRWPMRTFALMTGSALLFRAGVTRYATDAALYFNQLPAYLDVFACGMGAAALHGALAAKKRGALSCVLCSVGTVAVVLALLAVVRPQASCSGTQAIRQGQMDRRIFMGVLSGALLLLSANAGRVMRCILSNPVTRFVSHVSMQFYIWHQTLAVWIRQYRLIPSEYENPNYAGDLPWQCAYTFACFALSLLVAAGLTYGFERPMARMLTRQWKRWRTGSHPRKNKEEEKNHE